MISLDCSPLYLYSADLWYPPHAPLGDHTPVAVEPEQRPAAHHRAVHEADHPGPGAADPVCQVLGPVNVDQVQTLSLGYPARLFVSAIIRGFSCCRVLILSSLTVFRQTCE